MHRDTARLAAMLKGRHPAIAIATLEEEEAAGLTREAAAAAGLPVWTWSVVDGVREEPAAEPAAAAPSAVEHTENPAAAFFWLSQLRSPAVVLLLDAADHLDDPRAARALRHLLASAERDGASVVMIDHRSTLPGAIEAACARFELTLPEESEIDRILRDTLKRAHRESPIEIELSASDLRMIIKNLRGLTARQARRIIADTVAEDRRFSGDDLNSILAGKRSIIAGDGVLEYVESPTSLEDVGGLDTLKAWLRERERSFDEAAAAYGLRPPRGVLLLGVQGAGKSLSAKAIATAWQRPLLRLDPGSLYDRYVGESERRLRAALHQAEVMAPIVLWIDEIEKGFASAAAHSTDGGLSQRMFGALLTWMQDHAAPVFLVATANNIEALPPELLRKGRFDEIFFVDLPGPAARRRIFEIHLRRRRREPAAFDLDALTAASDGFSGAEIEQAVIGAMHEAFNAGARGRPGEPTTAMILRRLSESPPLSVTMAEKIAELRAWAEGRCVPAE